MPKPIHPAAVHFPIAFLFLGYGLDILYHLRPNLPGAVANSLPVSPDLTRASYTMLTLGLATALPAVVTGGVELVKMISKQGLYESDGKTVKTKVKASFAHAAIADLTLALTAYVWYVRRAAAADSLAGKLGSVATPASTYAPETWQVGVEAVTMLLLMVASNIGGTLTYNFGVGLSVGTSSGAKKGQ